MSFKDLGVWTCAIIEDQVVMEGELISSKLLMLMSRKITVSLSHQNDFGIIVRVDFVLSVKHKSFAGHWCTGAEALPPNLN